MPYQWDGQKILQRNTDLVGLRAIIGHPNIEIRMDLRQWLAGPSMGEIKRTLNDIPDLPRTKQTGEFDVRAGLIWQWVSQNIAYISDKYSQGRGEYFQFPAETIALKTGDCEDSAFLLASLLIASGISEYCVRAVLGTVKWADTMVSEDHAWVVYKDEVGVWRILEPTLGAQDMPDIGDIMTWPKADDSSRRGARPWYVPNMCLNRSHIWSIREIPNDNVEQFVRAFRPAGRPQDIDA